MKYFDYLKEAEPYYSNYKEEGNFSFEFDVPEWITDKIDKKEDKKEENPDAEPDFNKLNW